MEGSKVYGKKRWRWIGVAFVSFFALLIALGLVLSATAAPLCHPEITRADCEGADINIVGSGTFTLKIWVDGEWLDEVDAPGNSTVTLHWSDYPSIDVCQAHTLHVELWSDELLGEDDDTFGGPECCPPSVAVDKVLVEPIDGTAAVSETVVFNIIITNTGGREITVLPLGDVYDPAYFDRPEGRPMPNGVDPLNGWLVWNDLTAPPPHGWGHDLTPGQSGTVTVTFHVRRGSGLMVSGTEGGAARATRTRQAVPMTSDDGTIGDYIWYDTDGQGDQDETQTWINGV
ncbi:hypothetical protein DRN74_06155, partial [Candidatus Micrarchaeota archaeon]